MNEHDELRALLARIRRRWFALTALGAVARAALLAAVPIAAAAGAALADRRRRDGAWSRLLAVAGHRSSRRPALRVSCGCRAGPTIARSRGSSKSGPAPLGGRAGAVRRAGQRGPGHRVARSASERVRGAARRTRAAALREIDPAALDPRAALRRAACRPLAGAAIAGSSPWSLAAPYLAARRRNGLGRLVPADHSDRGRDRQRPRRRRHGRSGSPRRPAGAARACCR